MANTDAPSTHNSSNAAFGANSDGWVVNAVGNESQSLGASLREIWQYRALIVELVRRDLKLRYKNSIGGIAWSLLNPLMQIGVITVMMKFIQARPITNYSAYLFVLFLWNFIQISLIDGCIAIIGNGPLVRKVYFPRAILPLATLLGNLFHFGIAFVFTIVYFFALRAYPENLGWKFLLVIPVMLCAVMLCLGLSLILAYLNVFYEDVRFIVTAMMQLIFFTLPILFTIEQVKAKGYYEIYMLNPVATLMVTYQRALLPPPTEYSPGMAVGIPWGYLGLAFLTSLITLIVGFRLFEKYKWEMVERL